MSKVLEVIRSEALGLEVGETSRTTCPFCVAPEKAFAITRTNEGVLYICHRAKCGEAGFLPSMATVLHTSTKRKSPPKEYKGSLIQPDTEVINFLYNNYELTKNEIFENKFQTDIHKHRLFMPVFDWRGWELGHVAKLLNKNTEGPKTLKYCPNVLHYPITKWNSGPIVVVEDILSSVKCARYMRAAALLGSHLSDSYVEELMTLTRHLVLMLDEDTWHAATPKPLKFRKEYGLFFNKFDTPYITKDPKDLKDKELAEILLNFS